jgi:hypothetical protein
MIFKASVIVTIHSSCIQRKRFLVNHASRIAHRNNSTFDRTNHDRSRAYRGTRPDRSHDDCRCANPTVCPDINHLKLAL